MNTTPTPNTVSTAERSKPKIPAGAITASKISEHIERLSQINDLDSYGRWNDMSIAMLEAYALDIEVLAALKSQQTEGPLFGTGKRIECAVQDDPMLRDFGWLYIKHAGGNWVTAAKLEPFSMAILRAAGSIK